ncbi:hypothetical protein BXY82_2454 [Gelidibacter sediminis]|uniref:DUF4412 domain-containing protein n=2 Tax=Gelidibacter sediminis TaxID=1608710 RepID=A0A4R7PZE8_9FLAO|nr:hypothetical protein BXY82_2454 [Gelidibacter sediminis]
MRTRYILCTMLCLCMSLTAEAQIFKKLKKKAEQAVERTILRKTDEVVTEKTEKTIDDVTSKKDKSNTTSNKPSETENQSEITTGNASLGLHTAAKKDFFKEDVVILLHENGNLNQIQFFDADQIAVRIKQDDQPKGGYIDSEGFIYGYNEKENAFNKSSLMASAGQGMMGPTMIVEGYKLPPEPFMAQLQKQQDQGLTPNPFNGIVEFAFIYKPEQFRYEDFKEIKQTNRGKTYTKFEFLNEPGYEGSYVLFDDQNRLVEIYTNKSAVNQPSDGFQMDMMPPGESLLVYDYKPVEVQLPPAREVRSRGQDMMGALMGSFNKEKNRDAASDEDYDTSDSKGMIKSAKNSMRNNKVTVDMLPDSYDFDWEYKTLMVMDSKKKNNIEMTILIKENAPYTATQMVDPQIKDMGTMTMLFDNELNTMVMFMKLQGNQNVLQIYAIPEVKVDNSEIDYEVKELPGKYILNYNCKGLQLIHEKYIVNVYHTTEAKLALPNFFNFGANKNMKLPDLDPRLAKQFTNSLVMEMEYIDKKKAKNNFRISAVSLKQTPNTINKKDYKAMSFLSGAQMFKKD